MLPRNAAGHCVSPRHWLNAPRHGAEDIWTSSWAHKRGRFVRQRTEFMHTFEYDRND